MKSLKVLVAGGAGYIGSHMLLALQDAGHHVTVFDNLSRGHHDALDGAPLVEGDLCRPADLDRCLGEQPFDVVMHFAALINVGESVQQPGLYYRNNVTGSLNLLDAMHRHGLQRLVFSSTCAVYGEPMSTPMDESHPRHPINPYGRTKLMVEQALADYATAHHLQSVSLRYFNAAGADPAGRARERHDPETHLIPLVLAEALRLKQGGDPTQTELKVFGGDFDTPDGSCVRDYIHVTDLCAAHLLGAERLVAGTVQGAEAYNLGNGNGFSVLEVIEVCRRVTAQPIGYQMVGPRAGDPAALVGDARRARSVLGWKPQRDSLEQMIRDAWRAVSGHRQSGVTDST